MIDRFLIWANLRPDVRAGVILGSWARNNMPADDLSDLDLLVIVSDPSVFLSEASWLLTFGEPCLTFVEPTATGNFKERRVAFKDGKDIDFSLVPVEAIQQMVGQQIPAEIADVFRRGFRILVDKDHLAERLTDSARWPEKDESPAGRVVGGYIIVQWLFERPAPSLNRMARQSERPARQLA